MMRRFDIKFSHRETVTLLKLTKQPPASWRNKPGHEQGFKLSGLTMISCTPIYSNNTNQQAGSTKTRVKYQRAGNIISDNTCTDTDSQHSVRSKSKESSQQAGQKPCRPELIPIFQLTMKIAKAWKTDSFI